MSPKLGVPGWLYTWTGIGCLVVGRWLGDYESAESLAACHKQMANSPIGPTLELPQNKSRIRIVCLSPEGCGRVAWEAAEAGKEFESVSAEAVR